MVLKCRISGCLTFKALCRTFLGALYLELLKILNVEIDEFEGKA